MNWLWDFLAYSLPWYVQVLILALILGVPTYLVVAMVWGRETANRLLVPILGALALIGTASKLKQDGYTDRKKQEDVALDKAEKVVVKERTEVTALPDDKLDKETDEWSRP